MSWNEQDPFKKKTSGPPNIDNIIKDLFSGGKSGTNLPQTPGGYKSLLGLLMIAFIIYVISGFYIVKQPENAVITRFGKINKVVSSGLNWRPLFIDKVYIVNIDEILSFKKESQMLTRDENIVFIGAAIQYRRSDPIKFQFADQNPHETIANVAESAIRQAIGLSELDDILTTGKNQIKEFIKKDIKMSLENYDIGLELLDVNLTSVVPPKAVMEYFNDVTKAREDKFSTINEAERYRDSEIPLIKGKAEKIRAQARAYKEEKILKAHGETEKFTLLLKEYQNQPDIFKQKLYFDTIKQVLSQTSKVLIDESASQQLLYLPLDKLATESTLSSDEEKEEIFHEQSPAIKTKKNNQRDKINIAASAFRQ